MISVIHPLKFVVHRTNFSRIPDGVVGTVDVVESLSVEQFAITCSARATQLAWLVGAGISAAGGISTGYDMILDFKTRLFCAQMGLSRREIDSGDPLWNQRICGHFDGRDGMPPNGHPDEYSSYSPRVFPTELTDGRTSNMRSVKGFPRSDIEHWHRQLHQGRCRQCLPPTLINSSRRPVLKRTDFCCSGSTGAPRSCRLEPSRRGGAVPRENSWPIC